MNADALPRAAWTAARRRDAAIVAAFALPWSIAAAVLAWRIGGDMAALAAFALSLLAGAAVAALQWRRRDARWLVRELDARRPDMDDSADLLLAGAARNPLQRLQRQRLQQRLVARPADLRAAWPLRALAGSALLAALAAAAAVAWPTRPSAPASSAPGAVITDDATGPIRLLAHILHVAPPAYTRLPPRDEDALSIKAPQASQLRWRLRFSSPPRQAALVLLDGRRIELARDGEDRIASLRLDVSALYRIEVDGQALDGGKPHRLDAIADRPPQIKVLAPDRSLSLVAPGQRAWDVAFEASDDHGVAARATLRITLAQGSGENITFREQTVGLAGQGEAARRRYAHRLDLAALGVAAGDDLIVQLSVDDNRAPQPQTARSPSLILRWPSDLGSESTGIEGIVKRVLPAYFRSQRQIIIDAEALQKQGRALAGEAFLQRSDAIGVDQRILRLRYGQFLGEESEGAPQPPPLPTNDDDSDHHDDDGHDHGAAAHDGHDHADPAAPATVFGRQDDVLEAFGHTHDHAEAATLLDPETRATLKQALDQMWQSELQLRQGHPDRALPYAYKALEFIKQVQQASRIYLARVGPELPPIDEGRRLGGKRDGLAPRPDALRPAASGDTVLADLWRALDDAPDARSQSPDLDALERWLREHPARAADPLSLHAAIDALRRQPDCADCRADLRALLWPLLARPPAAAPRRPAADAQGRRYLDALEAESRR
ncbi:hypothetical protein [Pseudoxanthomonas mexicana]|uniref:hypothetical protein n=1 Tax=Pseudoxanthomonas mexicana TaxID=128785 RepID=UPI00398AAA4B